MQEEPNSTTDRLDELIRENRLLRKKNQILKAHCNKYQGENVNLLAEVNKLRNEKKSILAFITQKQLQQSELNIQLMTATAEESSDSDTSCVEVGPCPVQPVRPIVRRIPISEPVNTEEEGPQQNNVMKSGRPRRKAAPRNLSEENLAKKLRRN